MFLNQRQIHPASGIKIILKTILIPAMSFLENVKAAFETD